MMGHPRPTVSRHIPTDLIYTIFAWLPPIQTIQCRRVSRLFRQCLSSTHFAIRNITLFFHGTDAYFLGSNRAFDEMFFLFPDPYPRLCAEHLVSVMKRQNFISLRWNDLTLANVRLPATIQHLHYFQCIEITKTALSGPLPKEICLLVNLQALDLSENLLSGSIPDEIGGLVNLKSFSVSKNRMEGGIPEGIGLLVNLVELYLDGNAFSGQFPESFVGMTALRYLILANNQLSGQVPAALANLNRLEYLDLRQNAFVEQVDIPEELRLPGRGLRVFV
ncbi:hypothetical protein HDU98_005291 [Podochytrium sp. JEL0797]|nr:hypothetical protein HDU98_005291 [Podochytrium sp. JEL0797]